jgi:hypothetical protein
VDDTQAVLAGEGCYRELVGELVPNWMRASKAAAKQNEKI